MDLSFFLPIIFNENVKPQAKLSCLTITATLAAISLQSSILYAAVQAIPVETNDQSILKDGSVRWVAQTNARVGLGYGESQSAVYVLPFQLPVLNSGEQINSASLTINLEAWTNYGQLNSVDLYGLNTWSSSSIVSPNTDFIDGTDPGSNSAALLLQDDIFTTGDINNTTGNSQKIVKTSTDFTSFIQSLYASGARGGDYAFLVLVSDIRTTDDYKYYEFTTADGSANTPHVSLDIISTPNPPPDDNGNDSFTLAIRAETNDQTIESNLNAFWSGQIEARIGNGFSSNTKSVHVMPFELPTLEDGESIKSVSLNAKIQGWNNWQRKLENVDLYGISSVSNSSEVIPNAHFIDGINPAANPQAVLLSDNFATASDISSGPTGLDQSIENVSGDFGAFLQGLYDAGAQGGQYVFLVLAHDATINLQRFFEFSTANNDSKAPILSVGISSSGVEEPPIDGSTPTLWVDGSTTGTEDGSQANPYNTIQEAIEVAVGGDIIRVQGGTYFESLSFRRKFSSGAPLIVEGVPGDIVELSGAVPLSGWIGPNSSGIYTLETNQIVNELLVGDTRMPVARWPDINDGAWPSINAIDKTNDSVSIVGPLPPINGITSNIINLQAYLYVKGSNIFDTIYITGVTAGSPNKVKLLTSEFNAIENNEPTHLLFVNHPDLINQPGEWASEKLSADRRRIYFKPRTTSDLQATNTRKLSHGLNFSLQAPSHVTVRGLNIKSFRDSGANISKGASHITLEDLVVYNVGRKEVWGIGGSGISIRDAQDVTVRRSVTAMNSRGISVHSATNVVIDQCEIAKNDEDGIFALGDGPVRNTTEANGTVNLHISNSYIHHHLYQGHPDNIQYTTGVYNSTIDQVLAMYSGQNFISADTFNSSLTNSTLVGSGAINLIVGKKTYPDDKFNVIDNSILFSRFQAGTSLIVKNPVLSGNIMYALEVSNDIPPNGQLFTSDYNLYWNAGTGLSSLWTFLQPSFQTFNTLASFTAHTGEDSNSIQANPLLANIPKMVNLVAGLGESSRSRLVLLLQIGNNVSDFYSVGNKVEVNGDGVVRTVTAVNMDSITINPPLPEAPFRITLVANWGTNDNLQMDTLPLIGSPALGSGQNGFDIGADINIPEYEAGDFNGDGIRDIPNYPAEVGIQLSHPNEYTDPFAVLP